MDVTYARGSLIASQERTAQIEAQLYIVTYFGQVRWAL